MISLDYCGYYSEVQRFKLCSPENFSEIQMGFDFIQIRIFEDSFDQC